MTAAFLAKDPVVRDFVDLVRRGIGADLRSIVIFGSRARGEAWAGSDYDIAVILEQRLAQYEEKVLDAVVDMLDRYEALVSAQVFYAKEWEIEKLSPLGLNIAREGVAV